MKYVGIFLTLIFTTKFTYLKIVPIKKEQKEMSFIKLILLLSLVLPDSVAHVFPGLTNENMLIRILPLTQCGSESGTRII